MVEIRDIVFKKERIYKKREPDDEILEIIRTDGVAGRKQNANFQNLKDLFFSITSLLRIVVAVFRANRHRRRPPPSSS